MQSRYLDLVRALCLFLIANGCKNPAGSIGNGACLFATVHLGELCVGITLIKCFEFMVIFTSVLQNPRDQDRMSHT